MLQLCSFILTSIQESYWKGIKFFFQWTGRKTCRATLKEKYIWNRKSISESFGGRIWQNHTPTHTSPSLNFALSAAVMITFWSLYQLSVLSAVELAASPFSGVRDRTGERGALCFYNNILLWSEFGSSGSDWTPRLERPEVAEEGRSRFKEV